MGAWGVLPFENDDAREWVGALQGASDLSHAEAALAAVDNCEFYLEAPVAAVALAACEVLARLRGNPGYQSAHTAAVDAWVKKHPQQPSAELLAHADWAIKLVLGPQSELRGSWKEPDGKAWIEAVEDLRRRVKD